MAKLDRIVNGHSSREGCTPSNLSFLLLLFIFILTNSSVTSIRITKFPFFSFRERRVKCIFSHQGPTVPGIITKQIYFHRSIFYQRRRKGCKAHSPHGSKCHTGLFAHTALFFFRFCFFVLFCFSFLFFFLPEKVKILHYLTCHTGVIATQDYFHTGLFFFSQVYLPHGNIVYIVATQVYYILIRRYQGEILHASSATQDYLPHRLLHADDKSNL